MYAPKAALHYNGAVRLYLAASLDDLLHNVVEAGIIGCDSELLGNEAYGCGLNAVQLVDSVFHFLGAVCAVEILKLEYLFHNNILLKIVFILQRAPYPFR